jgi:hypothetical protein
LQTGFAVPPFFSVILFALFFANASQHIAILVPAVAKSCPNAKKQSKKTLRSNRHHHFTYARKKTG